MSGNINETAPSLREFVSAAILEIADGLHDAQTQGKDKGVKIYPNSYEDSSTPMDIEFDLSVKSIAQEGKGGGLGVKVFILGANYENKAINGMESSNRLRFTLPIHYVINNVGQKKYSCENGDWNPVAGKP